MTINISLKIILKASSSRKRLSRLTILHASSEFLLRERSLFMAGGGGTRGGGGGENFVTYCREGGGATFFSTLSRRGDFL